jgi:hypothetical protein
VGIFTESVVESYYVKDNQYKRCCATTTSICDNMRLRCQCHWRNTDTTIDNLLEIEEQCNARKRGKVNVASRKRKLFAREFADERDVSAT